MNLSEFTEDQLWRCRHVRSAAREGVDVHATFDEMIELQSLGVVRDVERVSKQRYTFHPTAKLDAVVAAFNETLKRKTPNDH